jgi:30S ribosomal protein S31
MGKGDKKTKRGKIVISSYGVRRARKKKGLRHGILHKPVEEAKPLDTLEQNPVVLIPEITPVVEQVEEKAPRKTAVKKAAPKKPAAKVEEAETKPKATKSKKKATKPADDLFTEKKEGTE